MVVQVVHRGCTGGAQAVPRWPRWCTSWTKMVPRWCPGVPIATIITPFLLGCTGGAQVAQVVHKWANYFYYLNYLIILTISSI